MKAWIAASALMLAACATAPAAPTAPQDAFMSNLRALCGQSYEGRVVTTDAADASFASERLVMHVRDCSAEEVRIPFNVGEDRSRTWVVTRTETGLRLKHDHRHADGTPDAVTNYGGDAAAAGSEFVQEFPADAETAAALPYAATNVWSLELRPGDRFVYGLRREGRRFRAVFDLSQPVPAPPPPWGE